MPFDLGKIGQLLKAARIEKGLTFEDVQHALFIRKSTIAAIESGDWQRLPPETYVRGYITQYASLLHILDLVKPELTPNEPTAGAQKEPGDARATERGVLAAASFGEENSRHWGHGRHHGRVSRVSERAETRACGPASISDAAAQPTGDRNAGGPNGPGNTA